MWLSIEGVVEGKGDAAGIAEEAVDAFAGEAFEQHFGAVHQFAGFGLHIDDSGCIR